MPLVQQTFKIDQFQLKHSNDADALRRAIHAEYSRDLAAKLIEVMPYQLREKYEGELPSAVLTRDHHFTETWRWEAVVLTREQCAEILNLVNSKPEIFVRIRKILEE